VTSDTSEYTVVKRDFKVTLVLEGTTTNSPAVGIDIPEGMVFKPSLTSGKDVQRGQILGTRDLDPGLSAIGSPGSATKQLTVLLQSWRGVVSSPVSGIAQVSKTRVAVTNPGIDAAAELTPLQQLRFRGHHFTGRASVETLFGQRDATCLAIWMNEAATPVPASSASGGPVPQASQGTDTGAAAAPGPGLRCRLGPEVATAAGLHATIRIDSETLPGAVVVPNVYVGYDLDKDTFFVNRRDGSTARKTPITVSSTDGVVRVVTSGITVGDRIAPLGE